MKCLAHFSMKGSLLSLLLFMCLLEGCEHLGTPAASGAQKHQDQISQKSQYSCPEESMTGDTNGRQIVYAVSWDAMATDADNNRGKSNLHVSALDGASGKLLWQKAPGPISAMYQSSLQRVVDGVLYIAAGGSSQKGIIIALDTRDGHTIWQREEQWGGVSSIDVCAGKAYLLSNKFGVQVLQASSGKALWSYNDKNAYLSSLVVTTKAVYVPEQHLVSAMSVQTIMLGLDADNGKILWKKSYGESSIIRLSLVANGQAAYILNQVPAKPSSDPMTPISSVQALDSESGKVLWAAAMPRNMEQIYVLKVDNIIYLNGQDLMDQNMSLLVALNAENGKQLWQRKHNYDQISLLNGQGLYGYKGYDSDTNPPGKRLLCSLDAATGKDNWCLDSLQPSLFSLSSTQDTVIVEESVQPGPLTLIQNIYGVSKQSGKLLWKLPWKSSSRSVQTLTLVTVIEGQRLTSFLS